MGIVCGACKHLNGFGSLSCSNCGKRLFDEDGSERTIDTKTASSEPGPPVSRGSGNNPLVIGIFVLFVAVALIFSFAIATSVHESLSNGTRTAPPQTTAAPAAQEQQTDQAPDAEEVKKVEETQRTFRSAPDPPTPVALNKIEGIWWASDTAEKKVFAFVELENLSASPYTVELSTLDGTRFTVKCFAEFPVMIGSRSVLHDPDYHEGRCSFLPTFTWIRVAMSGVITNPDAESWTMTYRESDVNPLQSNFLVTAICYPNGTCTTADEAGTRAVEEMRERARRGDN